MVMEGNPTWGGEHAIRGIDGVLWNCADETWIILLTSVTPIHSTETKTKHALRAF